MAKVKMTEEYTNLMEEISDLIEGFKAETEEVGAKPSKASLKRARKISLELEKDFKKFRKITTKLEV